MDCMIISWRTPFRAFTNQHKPRKAEHGGSFNVLTHNVIRLKLWKKHRRRVHVRCQIQFCSILYYASTSQVNQIHFVTSKSGLRKRLQTVDEHSLSLFIGQGCAPLLRGGYHRLTLKSALRADNVYILPAHYSPQPAAPYTHLFKCSWLKA